MTDVRHLKNKIRDDVRHKVNNPLDIAADFNVDMSLSKQGIAGMLKEYEADHRTKMNIEEMAGLIYDYTSGYPFLVSRLCQLLDEKVSAKLGDASNAWTMRGMDEAVKLLLSESNTLFQTITGKLSNYPELRKRLRAILMEGTRYTYNALQEPLEQMEAYGLIRNDHNTVKISNRIFEMLLYNLFLSDEELRDKCP